MVIDCAKSTKPLGVRGNGEAGFVFCPDPLARIQKGRRKKYAGTKVLISECQKCENWQGGHKTMSVVLVYENPFGDKERMGEKKIVLSVADAEKQKKEEAKWLQEERERTNEEK